MMPNRPLNTIKLGDHLVTTADGDVCYASETAVERYGPRAGLLVHRDDLDEPGRSDLPQQHIRRERAVRPVTGPPVKRWTVRDQNGNPV